MPNRITNVNGHPIKLVDNKDGTFSIATSIAGSLPKVTIQANDRDLRGKAADKPLATAVTIGTTYWSVDTDPQANAIEVSDGTKWVVI